jgi:hypothetical protein
LQFEFPKRAILSFISATILANFRTIDACLDDVAEELHKILAVEMGPVLFHASTCNSALRRAFDGGKKLVDDRFRRFCMGVVV